MPLAPVKRDPFNSIRRPGGDIGHNSHFFASISPMNAQASCHVQVHASAGSTGSNRERQGLLVIGHGTREPGGIEEFHCTCRAIAAGAPSLAVEGAFLEFAEPTIDQGVARLVARGASRMIVMPLLLFAAGHAKRDIPAAVAAAASKRGGVTVQQVGHLGCHPSIVLLSRQRFSEAIGGTSPVSPAETALVLVGRGSHDAEASEEMHAFALLRAAQRDVASVEVGFLSMAVPSLEEALAVAAETGPRRIVVQPHLLFAGSLIARARDTVTQFAMRYPNIEWLSAGQLGPSELVVRAVLERAQAAQ
jgi:sirohydrochlorin cobaltochelatase